MTLTTPGYLTTAGIQDQALHHHWDDDGDDGPDGEWGDQALHARLETVSTRAAVAFTIAVAEWVVHRFRPLLDDPFPDQFLEAAWALTVDARYSGDWDEFEADGWSGPVRGPVMAAVREVIGAITQMELDEEVSPHPAGISALARHVMTDPRPFVRWQEWALSRLQTLYPRDPEETLGDVVPREAFDPAAGFAPEQTQPLVNRLLDGLGSAGNPYLTPAGDLRVMGFEGVPYTFDLDRDRQVRLDW